MTKGTFIIATLGFLMFPFAGYSAYSSNDRVPGGEEMMDFITPDNWGVQHKVMEITSECDDKWEGYDSIHYWIRENISYTGDPTRLHGGENWKYPNETIRQKRGDCEDISCLRCSMLICYQRLIGEMDDEWYALWVALSREDNPGFHVSVVGNVEGYVQIYDYVFDNFGEYCEIDDLEDVWDEYGKFWGVEVIPMFVFNDKCYRELSGISSLRQFLSQQKV